MDLKKASYEISIWKDVQKEYSHRENFELLDENNNPTGVVDNIEYNMLKTPLIKSLSQNNNVSAQVNFVKEEKTDNSHIAEKTQDIFRFSFDSINRDKGTNQLHFENFQFSNKTDGEKGLGIELNNIKFSKNLARINFQTGNDKISFLKAILLATEYSDFKESKLYLLLRHRDIYISNTDYSKLKNYENDNITLICVPSEKEPGRSLTSVTINGTEIKNNQVIFYNVNLKLICKFLPEEDSKKFKADFIRGDQSMFVKPILIQDINIQYSKNTASLETESLLERLVISDAFSNNLLNRRFCQIKITYDTSLVNVKQMDEAEVRSYVEKIIPILTIQSSIECGINNSIGCSSKGDINFTLNSSNQLKITDRILQFKKIENNNKNNNIYEYSIPFLFCYDSTKDDFSKNNLSRKLFLYYNLTSQKFPSISFSFSIPQDCVLNFDMSLLIRKRLYGLQKSDNQKRWTTFMEKKNTDNLFLESFSFVPNFKYFEEEKKCAIGSNIMTSKNKTMNPKVTKSLTGMSTLTFSMYTQYWDEEKQEFTKNPFIGLLQNETKIKLNKDGKWYDFIIKTKEENEKEHVINYVCKDYHASMLGKQGYNTELSKDLYNNQGSIEQLTDEVLKESDWIQDKTEKTGTEKILEKEEETLYAIDLVSKIEEIVFTDTELNTIYPPIKRKYFSNRIFYDKNGYPYGRIGTFAPLKDEYITNNTVTYLYKVITIYMHYSDTIKEWKDGDLVPCYIQKSHELFFTQSEDENSRGWDGVITSLDELKKNSNQVIDDPEKLVYFKYSADIDSKKQNSFIGKKTFETLKVSNHRSKKIRTSIISEYIPKLKKYVQHYKRNDKVYYCYTDTEYVTPELVTEYMVNGGAEKEREGISSNNGWLTANYLKRQLNFESQLTLSADEDLEKWIKETADSPTLYTTGFLHSPPSVEGMYFYNSAINSHKGAIKNFTKGEKYILELHVSSNNGPYLTNGHWQKDWWADGQDDQEIYQYYNPKIWGEPTIDANGKKIYAVNPKVNIKRMQFTENGFHTNVVDETGVKYADIGNAAGSPESTPNKRWNDDVIAGESVGRLTYVININQNITEAELKNTIIGLQIFSNLTITDDMIKDSNNNITSKEGYGFKIWKASFYKMVEIEKDNEKYILAPDYTLRQHPSHWFDEGNSWNNYIYPIDGKTLSTPPTDPKIKYFLYDPSENKDKDKEDFVYIYQGYVAPEDQNLYELQTTEEKIRNIEISKSNTFNILQSLSESFGCWCNFDVEHEEDGRIKLANPPYRQIKRVSFHNFIGKENVLGYKKHININNIQRNVESDSIVTKLIVPDNVNQYAKNGICSIARASDNLGKDNVIYDLRYYIQMQLLPETAEQDLNSFLAKQNIINQNRENLISQLNAIIVEKSSIEAENTVWKNYLEESLQNLFDLKIDFQKTYSLTYEDLKTKDWSSTKLKENGILTDSAKNDIIKIATLQNVIGKESTDDSNATGYYKNYEQSLINLENVKIKQKNCEKELDIIKNNKSLLIQDFNQQYGLYLQEGTWSSQNYLDENLYYLDARQTLSSSSKPQVSYTISVINVGELEDYSLYKYEIGDRTTIEDPEYFGWTIKPIFVGNKKYYIQTPFQEEVVISEITNNLDDSTQDTISVKNYRLEFEDLFQKMSAATQALQYKEGAYDNAASAVGNNGQILPDSITNTFNNSSFVISHAEEQGLTWDNRGITIVDQVNKHKVIRIAGGRIWVSNNGGDIWSISIDGDGINANTITTGNLNITNQLNIKSGDNNAFTWNTNGINAYLYDNNQFYPNSKITFNQYGLFGGLGDGINLSNTFMQQLTNIHKNSRFALTWKGFSLKTGHANSTGYVSIDSDDDITLNVKPDNSNDYLKIIQIGHLESTASTAASDASESAEPTSQSSESGHYGIRVKDMTGNVILETTEEHVNGRFHINCGRWS